MRKSLVAVALLAASSVGSVHAAALDISLSDQSANVALLMEGSRFYLGGSDLGFGVYFNENNDVLMHASLLGINVAPTMGQPYRIAAGAKAYFGQVDATGDSLSAIGIGGRFELIHPHPRMPMSIAAEAYYAPDITSFGDAQNLLEFNVRLELDITPSTKAYLGYRLMESEFQTATGATNTVELDDSIHFGVRIPLQ